MPWPHLDGNILQQVKVGAVILAGDGERNVLEFEHGWEWEKPGECSGTAPRLGLMPQKLKHSSAPPRTRLCGPGAQG